MCTVHSASMTSLSELLALISVAFGFLSKHNSENKTLIRCHSVRLLVVIFSRSATREAMQDFPSDKKRRKETRNFRCHLLGCKCCGL